MEQKIGKRSGNIQFEEKSLEYMLLDLCGFWPPSNISAANGPSKEVCALGLDLPVYQEPL